MSLPAPNLDNRSFQSIVDDVEATNRFALPGMDVDHNVSDPFTLIESH